MALLQSLAVRSCGPLLLVLACGMAGAAAQDYPTRTVTIAVPYAAGGGVDVVTRIVAQRLSARLGQPFVVDNRLGAGGLLASTSVAKATPDGYTLLLATDAQLAAQVTLRKALPYDPLKDYVPVAFVGSTPFGLVVNASLPVHSVEDLIRHAREHPGKLSYGSSGPGGVPHLLTEMFMSMTGTKMTHVPYKGTAQALNDVVAGHVPMTFSGLVPVVGLLKEGKLRVLGVTSRRRVAVVPEAPPIAEAGVPGFEAVAWLMIVAPAGTPQPVVARLHAEISAIGKLPELHARYEQVGYLPPDPTPQAALAPFIKSEIERWGKVIEDAGIARSQ
ncbi:MAG: tripartite tricarboxylate transporter substrate binding protein [Hyphomicrobiales bacterium]|nr:tripartite tricarboxylate transporter substrate binding protein [Hyphomicrobiales bacterium]